MYVCYCSLGLLRAYSFPNLMDDIGVELASST